MFRIIKTGDGHSAPWEYLPAGAITPKVGQALYFKSGQLEVAGGANKPQYICMREESAAVAAGTKIPVVKIVPNLVFETVQSAAGTAVPGTSYDVAASGDYAGLGVAVGTTTNGGFIVDWADGSAVGDRVRGRFA